MRPPEPPPVCDVCGAVKRETNHWYSAVIDRGVIFVGPLVTEGPDEIPIGAKVLDLCGQSCVLKAVSEFMGAPAAPKESAGEATV